MARYTGIAKTWEGKVRSMAIVAAYVAEFARMKAQLRRQFDPRAALERKDAEIIPLPGVQVQQVQPPETVNRCTADIRTFHYRNWQGELALTFSPKTSRLIDIIPRITAIDPEAIERSGHINTNAAIAVFEGQIRNLIRYVAAGQALEDIRDALRRDDNQPMSLLGAALDVICLP
jgi:hypothetical protein